MAREKAPAFQFYPRDWLSDPVQACMSAAGAGAYIRLLCYCWLNETIPGESGALARLAGMSPKEWARVSDEVLAAFRADGSAFRHDRLDRIRSEHATSSSERSQSGRRGAQLRWKHGKTIAEPSASDGNTMASDSSSSSSSTSVPPVAPLVEGGDAQPRVLRRHRTQAEHIRDKAWGRCQHEPRCDERESCLQLIAQELASREERVA